MGDEVSQAFEHPEARARSSCDDPLRDRISLRDHVVAVEIGAFQSERGRPQKLRFDLVAEVRGAGPGPGDDVDAVLSYDTLTEAVSAELASERVNLLETLAERIAARVLAAPQALRCFVRIEKLDRGPGALGVEIVRSAASGPGPERQGGGTGPLIVHLSNGAIASPNLSGWLDQLAARTPLVLCVGAPDTAPPQSGEAAAQRRIDLLAIEQNAWVLAGRDPRLAVAATRTELDWAMRKGQMVVWAPSKLVLDAFDSPPVAGDALAVWLGARLAARALLAIGGEPPETSIPAIGHSLEKAALK